MKKFSLNTLFALSITIIISAHSSSVLASSPLGSFKNTYYYLVLESDYKDKPINDVILDKKGNVIARVNRQFRKDTDIEGSARLMDGRVINFSAVIRGKIRYHVSENPYGDGVKNCALVPFKTIAVDRRKIPLGSEVYIEETDGMILPDGSEHNGIWRADDVGGAIKENRIDLFIGEKSFADTLTKAGITHMQALQIHLVNPPGPGNCVLEKLQTAQ